MTETPNTDGPGGETDRGQGDVRGAALGPFGHPSRPRIVEQLAVDVGDGLPGEAVEDALAELKTNGPLWQLKVNCLRYCRFVHAHHGAEDVLLFPAPARG